jgi:hypothetical protein
MPTVNQQVDPASFRDQGVLWHEFAGVVEITGHSLAVQLADNANGVVIADAIRIERVIQGQPESRVLEQRAIWPTSTTARAWSASARLRSERRSPKSSRSRTWGRRT